MRGSKMGGVLLPNWSCSPILNKLLNEAVKRQPSPPYRLNYTQLIEIVKYIVRHLVFYILTTMKLAMDIS
jgi:hypothetical protein